MNVPVSTVMSLMFGSPASRLPSMMVSPSPTTWMFPDSMPPTICSTRAAGPVIAVGDDVAIDVLFKLDELEGAAGNHPAVSGRIPVERRRHADLLRHAFPHMLRQDHDLRQAYGGERRGRGLQLYPQAA